MSINIAKIVWKAKNKTYLKIKKLLYTKYIVKISLTETNFVSQIIA